ncbi:MAG TPA: hypothetical protein VMT24_19510 [Aggregatilineaceae bacterium]|nr:hypothetical protein [Aggregatilineaceae bacterium]
MTTSVIISSNKGTLKRHRITALMSRLLAAVLGIAMAWLVIEIGMRAGFEHLPPWVRGAIQNVRMVPWGHDTIIPPPPLLPDTDYQTILKPDLHNHEMFFADGSFHMTTIRLWDGRVGMRSAPPVWPVDIIAVGDSFTVCFTEFRDCWVERMRLDQNWSVMNLGQIATGSVSHLRILQTFGTPLKPKIVVWQWCNNDFNEDYGLARLRGETPALDSPAGSPAPDFGRLSTYSAVYATFRKWWYDRGHVGAEDETRIEVEGHPMTVGSTYSLSSSLSSPANEYGWQRTVEALDDAQQLVHDQWGAELVIVLVPSKDDAYSEYAAGVLGQEYLDSLREGRTRLFALCAERGWRCIDPTAVFQAEIRAGHMVYFRLDSHLNPYGNQILARVVEDYLLQNQLLPGARN